MKKKMMYKMLAVCALVSSVAGYNTAFGADAKKVKEQTVVKSVPEYKDVIKAVKANLQEYAGAFAKQVKALEARAGEITSLDVQNLSDTLSNLFENSKQYVTYLQQAVVHGGMQKQMRYAEKELYKNIIEPVLAEYDKVQNLIKNSNISGKRVEQYVSKMIDMLDGEMAASPHGQSLADESEKHLNSVIEELKAIEQRDEKEARELSETIQSLESGQADGASDSSNVAQVDEKSESILDKIEDNISSIWGDDSENSPS